MLCLRWGSRTIQSFCRTPSCRYYRGNLVPRHWSKSSYNIWYKWSTRYSFLSWKWKWITNIWYWTSLTTCYYIKLNNVLIVPDIKKKLLSVSQLTKEHNCYFIFYPWGFFLKDMRTKEVLLKGTMIDGLYLIQLLQHSNSPVGLLSTKALSNLWYARLGHPQSRIL
jgi:hypothetical protein